MLRLLLISAAFLTLPLSSSPVDGPAAEAGREKLFSRDLRLGSGFPGEKEIQALAAAYPGRITGTAFRGGDWALLMDGTWYLWASGRLLPESDSVRSGLNGDDSASGLRFYPYRRGLQPLRSLSEDEKDRLRRRLSEAEESPPVRNESFLTALYSAGTRQETEAQLQRVPLLGFSLRLHPIAARKLTEVDRELRALARQNPEIEGFFKGLRMIGGYHWRSIAGTASRSYHSYGIALDLIPKSYAKKEFYWRNILPFDEEWFSLPYEKRWMVPEQIVETFEKHGFIWGGKWLFFDTVHFEYRPEILILSDSMQKTLFPGGRRDVSKASSLALSLEYCIVYKEIGVP